MIRTFLNDDLAWKTFLSSLATEISEIDGICYWRINGRYQIIFKRPIKETDLDILRDITPKFNTFYLTNDDIVLLKQVYKVKRVKEACVVNPIENFSLVGRNYSQIRTSINKNIIRNFEILEDYKNYDDFYKMTERWDETCGNRHFRSRIGKNRYFYKEGFHRDGYSIFVYDKDNLIGYGTLSKPDNNFISSYVAGKALCHDYKGISEYIDVLLFTKGIKCGIKEVNTGGGNKNVINYKMKYPNSYIIETFDASCELKNEI